MKSGLNWVFDKQSKFKIWILFDGPIRTSMRIEKINGTSYIVRYDISIYATLGKENPIDVAKKVAEYLWENHKQPSMIPYDRSRINQDQLNNLRKKCENDNWSEECDLCGHIADIIKVTRYKVTYKCNKCLHTFVMPENQD